MPRHFSRCFAREPPQALGLRNLGTPVQWRSCCSAVLCLGGGRALFLTQLQDPREGQGGFPGGVIPGGSPSGGRQHQLLHQGLAAFKGRDQSRASEVGTAVTQHVRREKKKLIVTCSILINLPRLSNEGTESKVSSLGASSHLMQHISELCFFRNSSTAHECLCPCLTRTIGTPTSPAAEALGLGFFYFQDCTCAFAQVSGSLLTLLLLPSHPFLPRQRQQQVRLCLSERSWPPLTMLRIDISLDALPSKTPEIRAKKSTPWR